MAIPIRKIIHIDMDCFYAAIEIRDNPALQGKPVAIGGPADNKRGVLCTCNYVARQYGVRSAMPTVTAQRLCKDLIILPVDIAKYKQVSQRIQQIFTEFTPIVEPLALDEAYLDVSDIASYQQSATRVAKAIVARIWQQEQLSASAGVSINKFLAKIASSWHKPNGLFVIKPQDITHFISALPVAKIHGVGKVTEQKMQLAGVKTCADLQQKSLRWLTDQFGKLGQHLYEQSRGIDNRPVLANRARKSLSVETTFSINIQQSQQCREHIYVLYHKLERRIQELEKKRSIKSQFIKIKYYDFQLITGESKCSTPTIDMFMGLFHKLTKKSLKPIRLLGLGVHFCDDNSQQILLPFA